MTLDELHEWVFDGLGFCGCGDPEGALDLLRSVLSVIQKRSDENDNGTMEDWNRHSREIEKLVAMDTHPALAYSYLYLLDNVGLLEHGSNITGSWLTDKGRDVLAGLNTFTSSQIIEYDEAVADALDAAVVG